MAIKKLTCENRTDQCSGRLRRLRIVCVDGGHEWRPLVCEGCRDDVAVGRAYCMPCKKAGRDATLTAPGLVTPDWVQDIEMNRIYEDMRSDDESDAAWDWDDAWEHALDTPNN